ncbi:hypothetical protein H2509_20210 [Stappia sp. F7233]|uniref:Uncharacterized protein n=1 Tax=Stappia albiluteola TaxID=2758565 RepID=A0A839AKR6_9HYPH|nr:hypothetical protein [Stappia albiluteola]MBA5779462.1 hypothetical protein [Stappia albiluteola]
MARQPKPISPNFFSASKEFVLTNGPGGTTFGNSVVDYQIHRRRDVRNLGSSLGYLLTLKQRIIIPNQNGYQAGPTSNTSYDDYPAILVNSVDLKVNNKGSIVLQRIFPRTLNSAVSTSQSSDINKTSSASQETSSGSSNTNVNTFGVALSGGFFGELPMGSLTLDYSHTWENSTFGSHSDSTGTGTMQGATAGDSMSVKDWSAYGFLDAAAVNPTWIWGQSYPWDVIQYNQTNGTTINLPNFVVDRLMNGSLVLPPSQLSLFGLDFTMTAGWLIDFPDGVTEDETIQLTHTTMSFTASHSLSSGNISATLQSQTAANAAQYSSGVLDLSIYSIIPLNGAGPGNGAAIGFTATPFTIAPTKPSDTFKILSPANTLQVTGSGFDSVMTSKFTANPKMIFTFKISDYNIEYALMLMHWIGENSGACKVNWTVNKKNSGTLFVDSPEGEGGQGNVSSIELRNLDFTSINFHDYLVIGTNTVEVEVTPVNPGIANEYTLFAATVGEA